MRDMTMMLTFYDLGRRCILLKSLERIHPTPVSFSGTSIHTQVHVLTFMCAVCKRTVGDRWQNTVDNLFWHNVGGSGATCTISKHGIILSGLQMMVMAGRSCMIDRSWKGITGVIHQ